MRGFDILHEDLRLGEPIFLEASAGTGKTFAIEHLVAKFLLKEDLEIQQFLLVTFTKAAVSAIQLRLSSTLQSHLQMLERGFAKIPYLQQIIDQGESAIFLAKRKLKRALANFSEAPIFTIHSFCFHMLQEEGLIPLEQAEESTSLIALVESVKDFLRTELSEHILSCNQMDVLLSYYQNDVSLLAREITTLITKKVAIERGKTSEELLHAHQEFFANHPYDSTWLLEDLLKLAPSFQGMCDRRQTLKPPLRRSLETFCALKNLERTLLSFLPENRLKRALPEDLRYPLFLQEMQKTLLPIVEEYWDPKKMVLLLANHAKEHVERVIQKEGWLFFDDMIEKMEKMIKSPQLAHKIRERYQVVCIDEFQDTDPKQWTIFSKLFLSKQFTGTFCVVGDPKQSIYRFRDADLYTYLQAQKLFPESSFACLQKNFRATPALVAALNEFFASTPDFFPLPKWGEALPCLPVEAALSSNEELAYDGKKALHYFLASQEETLFSFMVEEIEKIHTTHKIAYSDIAILVKDRYQADRILQFCQGRIPAVAKRNRSLVKSLAFHALKDLLLAVRDYKDPDLLQKVLCGPLFKQIRESVSAETFKQFSLFNLLLLEKGILFLFQALLDDEKVRLALFSGSLTLYADLLQLIDLLAQENLSINGMLLFMEGLAKEENLFALEARSFSEEGVPVTTIHSSKGLEYAIVFAIGLILPSPAFSGAVIDRERECLTLSKEALEAHLKELDAEKFRQGYVALTRAKKRLYVPILEHAAVGSPIQLILQKILSGMPLETFLQTRVHASYGFCEATTAPPSKIVPFLQWEPSVKGSAGPFRPLFLHSYSSLAKPLQTEKIESEDLLPRGVEVGTLLHRLLEALDFQNTTSESLLSFVTSFLKETPLEGWEERVTCLIDHALHMPLKASKGTFSLRSLHPQALWKEMPFLYASSDPAGFLQGAIDLVCLHENRYYFIDWKSNLLADYSESSLEKEMGAHDYFLQASIYKTALEKHSLLLGNSYSWGGGYFIFLRGLPEGGVYRINPEGTYGRS